MSELVGQTLGHYRIVEKIGAGGMGEVYRAHDERLHRDVAIKVLPETLASDSSRLDRLRCEAEALAAIDHPSIVTIFSIEEADGVHFLTMQLVEGRELSDLIPKRGMPLDHLFETAVPLADALAAAHDKGVIHRDVKPGNIMVSDDGQLKVLDFGLAKLRREATPAEAAELPTELLTTAGSLIGTVPYMSPEQVDCRELDALSDIFSLGVVLYEMATGERPFKGESSASLVSAIMKETPASVDSVRDDLPHHLGRVIARCLEKNPKRRYQSAIDVHNELDDLRTEIESGSRPRPEAVTAPTSRPGRRIASSLMAAAAAVVLLVLGWLWLGRGGQPDKEASRPSALASEGPMIVVLPFENLGPPEDAYFADGITAEITSRLAMASSLGVISRTSAMKYKHNRPSLRQIGDELGVDYVLEGSVRWAKRPDGPDRVRITPQLIRVADDRHLWANNLERELDDIFAIQAEIAQRVIAELEVNLPAGERRAIETRPTDSLPAYEAYLKGLDALSQLDHKEAVRLFERAIERDPSFIDARARLVIADASLHHWTDPSEDWKGRSLAALAEVRSLAPNHPGVRFAAAIVDYYIHQELEAALALVKQLADEHPNNTEFLRYAGYIARRLGRFEVASAAFEQALLRDPRDEATILGLATYHRSVNRFKAADTLFEQCIAVAPEFGRCYLDMAWNRFDCTGDTASTREILERAPESPQKDYSLTRLDVLDRDYEAALARLEAVGASETGEWFIKRITAVAPYAFNDIARAREAARELVPEFERIMERTGRDFVDIAALSQLHAILGHQEVALDLADRAIELACVDHWEGPCATRMMAETCLIVGKVQRAIELADEALSSPSSCRPSAHWYHRDPLWDPVRDDPRFQALLDEHASD